MSVPAPYTASLAAFVCFIPLGTVLASPEDAQTISETVFPDNTPASNWTKYQIGDVLAHNWDNKSVDNTWLKPLSNGRHIEVNEEDVVSDWLDLKVRQTNETYERIAAGVSSEIAVGTAQVPFEKADRYVNGWLLYQGRMKSGADRKVLRMLAQMRITDKAKFEGVKVFEAALRFYCLPSLSGNTMPVGTSIVF
jgi:hypothetical protein